MGGENFQRRKLEPTSKFASRRGFVAVI